MALIISSKLYLTELEVSGSSDFGFDALATGSYSVAMGEGTVSRGYGSLAEGYYTSTGNFLGYRATSSMSGGVVVISSSYGGLTSVISSSKATHLLINFGINNPASPILIEKISSSIDGGSPVSTSIQLTNTSLGALGEIYVGFNTDPAPSGSDVYIGGGPYSHAEGTATQTVGGYSHAEGNNTYALADFSHTEGDNTIAMGVAQTVIGRYNQFNTTDLFIVGNGADTGSRSNILTVSTSSIQITGSMLISSSNFSITTPNANQTQPSVRVNSDGLLILGEHSATPTSVVGAIMYSGSDYYLGF